MGKYGVIPKRDAERRRVNDVGTVKIEVDEEELGDLYADGKWAEGTGLDEDGVPLADQRWHPIALLWYQSLKVSVQRAVYQASDWALAYLLAESLSRDLKPRPLLVDGQPVVDELGEPRYVSTPITGSSMSAYLKGMTALLVSEGDRLRIRLEVDIHKKAPQLGGNVVPIEQAKANLLG